MPNATTASGEVYSSSVMGPRPPPPAAGPCLHAIATLLRAFSSFRVPRVPRVCAHVRTDRACARSFLPLLFFVCRSFWTETGELCLHQHQHQHQHQWRWRRAFWQPASPPTAAESAAKYDHRLFSVPSRAKLNHRPNARLRGACTERFSLLCPLAMESIYAYSGAHWRRPRAPCSLSLRVRYMPRPLLSRCVCGI